MRGRKTERGPFGARDRIAHAKGEADDPAPSGIKFAAIRNLVPLAPAAESTALRDEGAFLYARIGERIVHQTVGLEARLPEMNLLHRFQIAKLGDMLFVLQPGELALERTVARRLKRLFRQHKRGANHIILPGCGCGMHWGGVRRCGESGGRRFASICGRL